MFKLRSISPNFFDKCIERKVEIKRFDKLPKLDNTYLLFLTKYQEIEVIPDIFLFGYETAFMQKYQDTFGILAVQVKEMSGF